MPYQKQYSYSGGGITLAELAFTRITGTTLRTAFEQEVAVPLGLTRSGFFQPLDEDKVTNAAFGGWLGILEDRKHGYHYYPEHAAAGFWSTPTELAKIGIALSRSVRGAGLLRQKTAKRMMTPILEQSGLCLFTRSPHRTGHSGWNVGFLTEWIFSPEEDLCVAIMTNRGMASDTKHLSEAAGMLFEQVCRRA
jgi:CubicO group peptidase (beta-lactamase class C family)